MGAFTAWRSIRHRKLSPRLRPQLHHAATRSSQLSFAAVVTRDPSFFAPFRVRPYPRLCRSDQISVAHERKKPLTAITAPALAGTFEALGHQHIVCSLHLAGPDRVAILCDIVEIHATGVVAGVTQCLLNFRPASLLSWQIPEGIYQFIDTVGCRGEEYGVWARSDHQSSLVADWCCPSTKHAGEHNIVPQQQQDFPTL